jgi:hypothetical protein
MPRVGSVKRIRMLGPGAQRTGEEGVRAEITRSLGWVRGSLLARVGGMRSGRGFAAVWLSVVCGTASGGCVGTTDVLSPDRDPQVQDESRPMQSTGPTSLDDAGSAYEAPPSTGDAAPDVALNDTSSADAPVDTDRGDSTHARASCGCTRRPGAGASVDCPVGIGESGSVTVGPDGGTVSLQGRQGLANGVTAELTFPAASMATTTDVTITETGIAPPQRVLDGSPIYRIEPAGLALAGPASLQLPFSGVNGSMGKVTLWFSSDGSCFLPVPDSSMNTSFVQGTITQLGYALVGVERTGATVACP